MTTHQTGKIAFCYLFCIFNECRHRTGAHNKHPVGNIPDFMKFVTDENNAQPSFRKSAECLKKTC